MFDTFFAIVSLLMGPGAVIMCVRWIVQAGRSLKWREVSGTILEAEIHTTTDSDGNMHEPRVLYEYTVAGQVHRGSRIEFVEFRTNMRSWALRELRKYTVNSQVPVYYDPDAPHESVLKPGIAAGRMLFVLVGIVFGLFLTVTGFQTIADVLSK